MGLFASILKKQQGPVCGKAMSPFSSRKISGASICEACATLLRGKYGVRCSEDLYDSTVTRRHDELKL